MSTTDKVFCWACKREVPVTELTEEGRHDEDQGGCGCYLDTAKPFVPQKIKSDEQLAFEAGYKFGALNEAFDRECQMEDAYKLWKGLTK